MLTLYPAVVMLRYGYTNVPRKRVNAAARAVHKLRFEGLMQKLQTEVDYLGFEVLLKLQWINILEHRCC